MYSGTVDAGVSFWICVAAAVLLSGGMYLECRSVFRLRRDGVRTEGIVIDVVENEGGKSRKRWVPVIAFTDIEGYHVEFSPRVQSGRRLPLGSRVDVVYLPEKPWAARKNSWSELWFAFTVLAGFLIGLGWVLVDLGTQVLARGGM